MEFEEQISDFHSLLGQSNQMIIQLIKAKDVQQLRKQISSIKEAQFEKTILAITNQDHVYDLLEMLFSVLDSYPESNLSVLQWINIIFQKTDINLHQNKKLVKFIKQKKDLLKLRVLNQEKIKTLKIQLTNLQASFSSQNYSQSNFLNIGWGKALIEIDIAKNYRENILIQNIEGQQIQETLQQEKDSDNEEIQDEFEEEQWEIQIDEMEEELLYQNKESEEEEEESYNSEEESET